jgi:hypothetical protein
VRNFACESPLVQSLDIAIGKYVDWTVDVNFDEVRNALPNLVSRGVIRDPVQVAPLPRPRPFPGFVPDPA